MKLSTGGSIGASEVIIIIINIIIVNFTVTITIIIIIIVKDYNTSDF